MGYESGLQDYIDTYIMETGRHPFDDLDEDD